MHFEAPKPPTRDVARNPAKLTGAASLAESATPGTAAPKVQRLPKLEKKPSQPPQTPLQPQVVEPLPPLQTSAIASAPLPAMRKAPTLASRLAPSAAPSSAKLVAAAPTGAPKGDPAISWSAADWDMVLVLPLPEDRAAAAAEKTAENAEAAAAGMKGNKGNKEALKARQQAENAKRQAESKAANAAIVGSSTARNGTSIEYKIIEPSEIELRKGLQLADADEAADGSGSSESSTKWLIGELRRRVLVSGLECKVVKLLPCPDTMEEEEGEHEVLSRHSVALVCIGAAKQNMEMPALPSPPPSPPEGEGEAPDAPEAAPPPEAVEAAPPPETAADPPPPEAAADAPPPEAAADAPPPTPPPPPPPPDTPKSAKAQEDAAVAEAKAEMKAAKEEEQAEKAAQKAEAKAVKAEAKAQAKAVKAEEKEIKAEAKAEAKGVKAEAKAEKDAAKGEVEAKVMVAQEQAKAAQEALKAAKREAKSDVKALKKGLTLEELQRRKAYDGARASERFPRLEIEAEAREMRLPTISDDTPGLPGPRAIFRVGAARSFPAFRSMLRQTIEENILEGPLAAGGGAGLNLPLLVSSGRVKELIYVHDDDEVEDLKTRILYGTAGVRPLKPTTLHLLHSYVGGEVSFYFAWVSAYTRSLLLPAFIGLILWITDVFYFDAAIKAERYHNYFSAVNATNAMLSDALSSSGLSELNVSALAAINASSIAIPGLPGALTRTSVASTIASSAAAALDAEQMNLTAADFVRPLVDGIFDNTFYANTGSEAASTRAYLTAFFGFVIIIWSAGFQETWKRRQALIAFGWGEMGNNKPPPSVNPFFKPKCIKSGFYTEDGLWVELSQQPTDAPPSPTKSKGSTTPRSPEKEPLVEASAPPVDVWFPLAERLKRQWTSAVVLVAMTTSCIFSIFAMQLFASFMRTTTVVVGGSDISSTIASVSNALMITFFNVAWREIAILLSEWENYRLTMVMREQLTYKLFVFQCINCYFMISFAAFFHPTGAQLFGVDVGRCNVRAAPGELSCADEVRSLLYSILFSNIIIGQATEVGIPLFAMLVKRIKRSKKGPKTSVVKVEPAGESGAVPDLETIAKKKREKQPLTPEESKVYDEQKAIINLIAEYERPLVKSVQQGLGNTFYEYNELALQYGYLVLFSMLLPAAPVLAFVNNIIEIRSDALKTIYAQRRTRAEPADDIGAWAVALKCLSFVGIFSNLAVLFLTSDFFDELAFYEPAYRSIGTRLGAVLIIEHALIAIKLFVDFVVPDVPAKVRVRLAREEHNAEMRVASEMQVAAAALNEEM